MTDTPLKKRVPQRCTLKELEEAVSYFRIAPATIERVQRVLVDGEAVSVVARGDNLRSNLPWVCLLGVGIIIVCDIIGRVIRVPFELPVSMILGMVGAAVFITLLLRMRRDG